MPGTIVTLIRIAHPERRASHGLALGACLLSVLFGCSGDHESPTSVMSPSAPLAPASDPSSPSATATVAAANDSGATPASTGTGAASSSVGTSSATGEEFNCTNLTERNARFSDPGFIDGNRVGLYYNYVGVPTGRTLLELFWDEENDPTTTEVIDLGDGEVERNDDARTDYEGIVEHVYPGITSETPRVVRANLISYGRTGNCATVRHIMVGPGEATGAGAGSACSSTLTGTFAGGTTQLGRIFRDGIASTCAGKSYPGIFNAATIYNYQVFNFHAIGSGLVCVKVNFDPNSGGTPCGTNAHASAYSGTYNPGNQSANYLGDVGSSVTQSFQFPLAGGAAFQVVVTNTASAASCSFSFTVNSASCP
jgi:hypothetical protein